jgi:hypothetical protein
MPNRQTQYIIARRAWQPGERDALVDRIVANNSWAGVPYVGNLSSMAPVIYSDTDSVSVIVPNPLYAPSMSRTWLSLHTMPPSDATWGVFGIFLKIFNEAVVPRDTLSWNGVFWYKIGEETWKGYIVAATPDSVYSAEQVNTTPFVAGGSLSGAGGGEVRLSTGEDWTANAGNPRTIEITAAAYGAETQFTSEDDPFRGGYYRTGTVNGRVNNVVMTPNNGATSGNIAVDLDFRTTAISAVGIICTFPVPCIGDTIATALRARPTRGATLPLSR